MSSNDIVKLGPFFMCMMHYLVLLTCVGYLAGVFLKATGNIEHAIHLRVLVAALCEALRSFHPCVPDKIQLSSKPIQGLGTIFGREGP